MKHFCNLCVTLLFGAMAAASPSTGFSITGTVTGLPNDTWLYLQTTKPYVHIDSCQVIDGRFSLKGRLTEKAATVVLRTVQFKNYVFFWLENAPIQIALQAGAFKKGTITGSATEEESKAFYRWSNPLHDSIYRLGDSLAAVKNEEERDGIRSLIKEMEQLAIGRDQDWIKTHPNSIVSANILNVYAAGWGKEKTQALFTRFSAVVKATKDGRAIADYLALVKNIRVGGNYADFEQPDTAGTLVRLSNLKAKYILLDFWASWCGPCRQENPNLVKTYAQFKDKGFAVLGVSLDESKAEWSEAIRTDQLTWDNVSDLRGDQNKAALMYGIYAVPTNYLIDEKGVIVAQNLRGQALDNKLKKLLP